MFTRTFLRRAAERALRTYFQIFIPMFGIGSHWGVTLSADFGLSAMAAFLSVGSSIIASKIGDPEDPSFVR